MTRLVLVSRKSELAMWQSLHVRDLLQMEHPNLQIEVVGVTTKGDRNLESRLEAIGGKGVFITELEQMLGELKADIAVHSMKDVPVSVSPQFSVCSVGEREDPADCFVGNQRLEELPLQSIVGTASLRRKALLAHLFKRTNVEVARGNVQTRLKKLDDKVFDGLILASAGLHRLGLQARIQNRLDPSRFVPSAGQGVLAVQYRSDDRSAHELVSSIQCSVVEDSVTVERSIVAGLGGDCSMALGVNCTLSSGVYQLFCAVLNKQGTRAIFLRKCDQSSTQLIETSVEELHKMGAMDLLNE